MTKICKINHYLIVTGPKQKPQNLREKWAKKAIVE